jgi:DNA-binding response OmpR family regulator
MDSVERRQASERRRVARGGRRPLDPTGRYPPLLVADSDDGVRRVCVRYLDRFGFDVGEAATGEAAVETLEVHRPKVAIAEFTLPRDDEFLARVRAYGVPCIVTMTSDLDYSPPEAVAVLVKPFSFKALLTEIRRVLSQPVVASGSS